MQGSALYVNCCAAQFRVLGKAARGHVGGLENKTRG